MNIDMKALLEAAQAIEVFYDPLCCEPREFSTCRFGGYSLPPAFPTHWEKIYDSPISVGDVAVLSPPKAGTTWVQQIAYLVQTEDFEGASKIPLDDRYRFLEGPCLLNALPEYCDIQVAKGSPVPGGPNFLKSHLPPKLLPKDIGKANVIFVYRNAKDAAVSYYHHYKAFKVGYFPRFKGSFEDFARAFMKGIPLNLPYGKMIADYFELKKSGEIPNLLILRYEDMIKDHKGAIRKIAGFLGKELSDLTLEKIYKATRFDSMKTNEAVNLAWAKDVGLRDDTNFIRKGVVGDWKNHFADPKLVKEFDEHIKEEIPEELYHILE